MNDEEQNPSKEIQEAITKRSGDKSWLFIRLLGLAFALFGLSLFALGAFLLISPGSRGSICTGPLAAIVVAVSFVGGMLSLGSSAMHYTLARRILRGDDSTWIRIVGGMHALVALVLFAAPGLISSAVGCVFAVFSFIVFSAMSEDEAKST